MGWGQGEVGWGAMGQSGELDGVQGGVGCGVQLGGIGGRDLGQGEVGLRGLGGAGEGRVMWGWVGVGWGGVGWDGVG